MKNPKRHNLPHVEPAGPIDLWLRKKFIEDHRKKPRTVWEAIHLFFKRFFFR